MRETDPDVIFYSSILHPRFIGKISLVTELILGLSVLTLFVGIIVYYILVDRENLDEKQEGVVSSSSLRVLYVVGRQEAHLYAKLCLLTGEILYVLTGFAGLWIYHGNQLWKWTLAYVGGLLASGAFFTWIHGVSLASSHRELAQTIAIFWTFISFSVIALSVALFYLHLFKGFWGFKLGIMLGIFCVLIFFPLTMFLDPFGLSALVFLITGTVLTVPGYFLGRYYALFIFKQQSDVEEQQTRLLLNNNA